MHSCVSNRDFQTIDVASISSKSQMKEVFSEIQLIPLDSDESSIPKGLKNIVADRNYILLCDNDNVIHVYSKDGRKLSDSKKKIGHGYGEYYHMTGWSYNKHSQKIEIVTPNKLISYDVRFNFVNSVDLPTHIPQSKNDLKLFFRNIYDLSTNVHLLIPSETSTEKKNTIFIFDSEQQKILKQIEYGNDIIADINSQDVCFFEYSKDSLFFYPQGVSDYLYLLGKTDFNFDRYKEIKWGEDCLSRQDVEAIGNNRQRVMTYLMNCEKEIPMRVMFANGRAIATLKKGNKFVDTFTYILDINNNKGYRFNIVEDNKIVFPQIAYVDGEYAYGVSISEAVSDIMDAYSEDSNYPSIKAVLKKDQMIILKCKLK